MWKQDSREQKHLHLSSKWSKHILHKHSHIFTVRNVNENKNMHILPNLNAETLISLGYLCDDICTCTLTKNHLNIYKRGKNHTRVTQFPHRHMEPPPWLKYPQNDKTEKIICLKIQTNQNWWHIIITRAADL